MYKDVDPSRGGYISTSIEHVMPFLCKAIFVFRPDFVCFEAQITLAHIFEHSSYGWFGKEVIIDNR